jgi:PleD family two-component response regulator
VAHFLVRARVAGLQVEQLRQRLQRRFRLLQVTLADGFAVQRLAVAGVITDLFNRRGERVIDTPGAE